MWSDLGNAYRVKGDVDLAIQCFDNAIRLQPHPDFYLNLGSVRMLIEEEEEGIGLFTLGLQMNPRHALLQYSIGNAYAALQDRPEEAARASSRLTHQSGLQGCRGSSERDPRGDARRVCAEEPPSDGTIILAACFAMRASCNISP